MSCLVWLEGRWPHRCNRSQLWALLTFISLYSSSNISRKISSLCGKTWNTQIITANVWKKVSGWLAINLVVHSAQSNSTWTGHTTPLYPKSGWRKIISVISLFITWFSRPVARFLYHYQLPRETITNHIHGNCQWQLTLCAAMHTFARKPTIFPMQFVNCCQSYSLMDLCLC